MARSRAHVGQHCIVFCRGAGNRVTERLHQWMQHSTRTEIEEFLASLNPQVSLPTNVAQLADDACPFEAPRN